MPCYASDLMQSVLEADSYVRRMAPPVERTVADKLRLPICRDDFGPAGEPGDTYFRKYLEANPSQVPLGWDERDAKV